MMLLTICFKKMPCLKYNEPSNVACELDTQIGLFILLKFPTLPITKKTIPSHPLHFEHLTLHRIFPKPYECIVLYRTRFVVCRSIQSHISQKSQCVCGKYIYIVYRNKLFSKLKVSPPQMSRHIQIRLDACFNPGVN